MSRDVGPVCSDGPNTLGRHTLAFVTATEAANTGREFARASSRSPDALLRSLTKVGLFDIFLSHSSKDAEIVLGIKTILERSGKQVYVDWIDDPGLGRNNVSAATAAHLRGRMQQCNSLVYAATGAATDSKWMPWELGYFDGRKGPEAVAIMPIVQYQGQDVGQEYLDLYPTVERGVTSYSYPAITRTHAGRRETKSFDALVAGRGGYHWS